MCTVTVLRYKDRLIVTMNRDESRNRGNEIAPIYNKNDSWSGPLDKLSGGTWFGLSHHGIVGCLMNGYDFEVRKALPEKLTSRGKLIPAALQFSSIESIKNWLEEQDFNNFASFRLLIIDRTQSMEWTWNGEELISNMRDEKQEIYSSSSWKQNHTITFRKKVFETFLNDLNPTDLSVEDCIAMDFHHLCADAQAGPLIQREEAVTKSITQAIIRQNDDFVLRYWPKPEPGNMTEPKQTILPKIFHNSLKE